MPLTLQQNIIYGPVNSRRLGRSLGINLLPCQSKLCTFDCLYCQYGLTKHLTSDLSGFDNVLPSVEDVVKALTKYLDQSKDFDYLTFSGNGEACSHPQFCQIVDAVLETKNKFLPDKKVAILSNSSMLDKSEIINTLDKLDLRIMKFDCGNENTFTKYNRPCKEIFFEQIFNHLKDLNNIVIQTLLAGGERGNFTEKNVKDWQEKIAQINPLYVQLYSLHREPSDSSLKSVLKEELLEIKNNLEEEYKIRVEIY